MRKYKALSKFIIVVIILPLVFTNCSQTPETIFSYQQNFAPDTSELHNQTTRLEFEDVREEGVLSNWGEAGWMLADQGVRVVGSRQAEVERREKLVKDVYQGNESFVTIRGFRVHWLTLSMGDLNWRDYTVSTSLKLEKKTNAGIAFRYLNSREYYAFVLDTKNQLARLVLRKMDKEATVDHPAWDELKTAAHPILPDKIYQITTEVKGDHIVCSIDDTVVIDFKDTYRKNGKVALIADDPALFGPVSIEGKMDVIEPVRQLNVQMPELVYELPLPGGDIDRRFWFLDLDGDGEREILIAERDEDRYAYRSLEFDGTELWRIDDIAYPTTEAGDHAINVFDINGDGKNEIITAIDFQIQIREGNTGNIIKSVPTPDQNPYYDSRDYPYPKLLGDAICPVQTDPDKPSGFYIKDRYTNIWLYDNELNQLWHKALSTAHFPIPVDIDDDGIEEIMVNHTLLSADGTEIWKLPLSDHVDNQAYVSLHPGKDPKYFYMAGGEMGLLKVNPSDGEILKRFELGHIQANALADFLPDREGLELLTQTYWREDGIFYLFDKDLNMVSTWKGDPGGVYPVQWGKNGGVLALISGTTTRFVDPLTGEVMVSSLGRVVGFFGDNRWGNALVVTQEENHLKIYSSLNDSALDPVELLYTELQSGYLPIVNTSLYQ